MLCMSIDTETPSSYLFSCSRYFFRHLCPFLAVLKWRSTLSVTFCGCDHITHVPDELNTVQWARASQIKCSITAVGYLAAS